MTEQHRDAPTPDGPRLYDGPAPAPIAPPVWHATSSDSPQAPALRQPRWSGKKTAVVAALAIGLSSAGAITASAAVPSGSIGGDGVGGRGGFGNFRQFNGGTGGNAQQPGGTTGQGNGVAPNGGNAPGAAAP